MVRTRHNGMGENMEKMSIETATATFKRLGGILNESYKKVTGAALKNNETSTEMFHTGLAGYVQLKLGGENSEMDEAYQVVLAYIGQQCMDHYQKEKTPDF